MTKCKLMSGKAFVEYDNHESANKAQQMTNEKTLDGAQIWVEFSG